MAPPIPKRRRLYSLEPMNVGTAEVESLTGYVARTAEAHCVTVSDLAGAELSSSECPTPLFARSRKKRSNFFYTQLYSLNGLTDVPRKWISVLETVTLRQGLSDLTLLAFADLFSESHLSRNVSAWCPSCFERRRRCGVRYESLLWAIGIVTVCPLHRKPLEEICLHCHRRSRPLTANTRPGYCSRCGVGWVAPQGPRLGISTSWVYCLHGDLARAIAARHLKERVESMQQRREQLRIEVAAIVKEMLDRGEHPVQARLRKMLSADSLKARRMLRPCLNRGNLRAGTPPTLSRFSWEGVIEFD